jgi:hypothetical protein
MTLYNIVGDITALIKLAEGAVDEETGEVTPVSDDDRKTIAEWFEQSEKDFNGKFDNICKFRKNLQADAEVAAAERDALKAEMDRLSKRAKATEAKADRMKALILYAFEKMKIKKHKTALFSAGIQATAEGAKPTTMFNADLIPSEYLKRELAASKVKEAVQSGKLTRKDGPLDRGKLFYLKDGEETELKGVAYLGGETLVIR